MNIQTAEEIIDEYRRSKAEIRKLIGEYEQTEMRLFHVMLQKLNSINNRRDPDPNYLRGEQYRSLD